MIIVPAEDFVEPAEPEEDPEDPAESPPTKRRAVGKAPQGTSATSDAASMSPPRFVPRQPDVESAPLAPQPKSMFSSVLRRRGAQPKSL